MGALLEFGFLVENDWQLVGAPLVGALLEFGFLAEDDWQLVGAPLVGALWSSVSWPKTIGNWVGAPLWAPFADISASGFRCDCPAVSDRRFAPASGFLLE